MLRCWRRTPLEATYQAVKTDETGADSQSMPPSSQQIDWELALSRGMGGACEYCGDDTQIATHVSPLCGHSACQACWTGWARSCCMLCKCEIPEGGVVRAPEAMVALTRRDVQGCLPFDPIDTTIEAALSALVQMKQELGSVKNDLETAVANIRESAKEEDVVARVAVLQVEASAVGQQMQRVATLLGDAVGWALCTQRLELVCEAMSALRERLQSPDCLLSPATTKRCRMVLYPDTAKKGNALDSKTEGKKALAWQGQWTAIEAARTAIFTEVLPLAIRTIVEAGVGEEAVLQAVSMLSALETRASSAATGTHAILVRLDELSGSLLQELICGTPEESPPRSLDSTCSVVLQSSCVY